MNIKLSTRNVHAWLLTFLLTSRDIRITNPLQSHVSLVHRKQTKHRETKIGRNIKFAMSLTPWPESASELYWPSERH
jgi:hypothetical protein